MNWALRRCSLYEVNSVCYAQFSLSFNNFFLILHTHNERQLPPEKSHCWPPCTNNQQNTILTDETTDSAKSLINRPSNSSLIEARGQLWPQIHQDNEVWTPEGPSKNWHLQGALPSDTFKHEFCKVCWACWVPSSCLHSHPVITTSDPERLWFPLFLANLFSPNINFIILHSGQLLLISTTWCMVLCALC